MEVATEQLRRICNDASLQRITERYASFAELKEPWSHVVSQTLAEKRGWRAERGGEGIDIAIQNRSSHRIAVLQSRNQELPIK